MSDRIRTVVERFLIKHGAKAGKAALCQATGRSHRTIDRWIEHGFPKSHSTYKIALACGCKKQDALRMACEEDIVTEEPV